MSSEYFYEVYMTEFPVTRYNNLRLKLDYHSNVFVKVGVHERAIGEGKLSLLKYQRCSAYRMQKQFVNVDFAFGLIKVRRYVKGGAKEILNPHIFAVSFVARSLGLYPP